MVVNTLTLSKFINRLHQKNTHKHLTFLILRQISIKLQPFSEDNKYVTKVFEESRNCRLSLDAIKWVNNIRLRFNSSCNIKLHRRL